MPIYEYEGRKCGHHFEYLILPSSPTAQCPKCKHEKLNKMVSLCAISSESTQQSHLKAARKAATKINKEKQYEEQKPSTTTTTSSQKDGPLPALFVKPVVAGFSPRSLRRAVMPNI